MIKYYLLELFLHLSFKHLFNLLWLFLSLDAVCSPLFSEGSLWSVTLFFPRFVKRLFLRPASWRWSAFSFLFLFLHLWEKKAPGSDDAMVHYLISVNTERQGAAQDKL